MRAKRGKGMLIIGLIILFILSGLLPATGTSIEVEGDALLLRLENQRLGMYLGENEIAQWQLPRGAVSLKFSQFNDYIVVKVSILKEDSDIPSETYFCVDAPYASDWHLAGAFDTVMVDYSIEAPGFLLAVGSDETVQNLHVLASVSVIIDGPVGFLAAVPGASVAGGMSPLRMATPGELSALLNAALEDGLDAMPEKLAYFDLSPYTGEAAEKEAVSVEE